MKIASVYEREEAWYFQPSSKTTNGLWVATPPVIRLAPQDSTQRKGEAAIEALGASRESIPIPANPSALVAPLLAMAKVRSWPAFMKRAKLTMLELDHGTLRIIPQKKLADPEGALESLPEKTIELSEGAHPAEIGAALEEAMARFQ
jgi:hypothetical protein